jgi:HK97 family phage prohead protease
MSKIERRRYQAELRLDGKEDGSPVIRGHAAVFSKPSHVIAERGKVFREIIRPGAFTRALSTNPDVFALFNHDENMVLGRTSSGTARVWQDETGLAYEIDPPNTSYANDLMESLRRGDINASSFAFSVQKDSWRHEKNGELVRELIDVSLMDVSPVTHPAYPDATSEARSFMWPEGVPEEVTQHIDESEAEANKELEALRSKVAEAEQRASEALAKVADLEKSNEVLRLSNEKLQREAKDAQDLAAAEENRHAELMQQTKEDLEQSHSALTEASRVMGVIAVRDQLIAEMFGHIKTASTQATELAEHKRDGLSDAIAQVEGAIRNVKSVTSDFGRRLLLRSLN